MSLRNLTSRNIAVKAKSIVAQVTAANVVHPMLTIKNPQESEKNRRTKEQKPLI